MSFRFVVGRANKLHSQYILDEMTSLLNDEPLGPEVLLLVPDQMTFQHEYALFQESRIIGSMRGQVSSFSRLAWRVIQETGGKTRQHISSNGIQMALRKIIEQKEGDWAVFQKVLEKQGFLTQLEGMITEFKRHDVTPADLKAQMNEINQFVHKSAEETALYDKLSDLTYIFEHLGRILEQKYLDGEDQLDLLIEAIETTDLFEGSTIFIDGFYRFTPKEMRVVEALLQKCQSITMTLIVDPMEVSGDVQLSELDLFYQTKETFIEMKTLVEQSGSEFHQPVILDESYEKYTSDNLLHHLEKNFTARPAPALQEIPPIQIAEAVHPRAEVEGIAQEILRLTREEGARFRDMAIFMRDSELYNNVIQTVFADYNIPVFIDEKNLMLHHSLIEFIRSLLEMIESDWRYESVFRLLKTGFIPSTSVDHPLTVDAIDELENYVIKLGIRGRSNWLDNKSWSFKDLTHFKSKAVIDQELAYESKINAYREQVARSLEKIDEQIRSAENVRDYCEAIYLFIEELNITSQLEVMQEHFLDRGELEKAQEQEQVWSALIQLLDEFVEIAGEETLDLTTFRKVLDSGLESLEFSHVPPAIDQVIVGTVDQSRIGHVQYSFLLGVNEGLWPLKPSSDRVMTEEERELLKENGLPLADTSSRQLLDDLFYMYLGFSAASEQIWVSYSISNGEGRMRIPSQMIKRLYDLYPSLEGHLKLLQDPDELIDARRFITTPQNTRSTLTVQLAKYERNYAIDPIWFDVYNWYVNHEEKYHQTYNVLQSLNYKNEPVHLQQKTVESLYSKRLSASVSRLEMYQKCSYQYFLQYGLRLKERERYKLEAPDIGNLFHESLRQITEWVIEEKSSFKNISLDESVQYASRAIQQFGPTFQHKILESSHRYKYIQQKLERIIARATYILGKQAELSDFTPIGLEIHFGQDRKLAPLTISLENGYELILRGQIDRVDELRQGEDLYLRIIDYKSSAHRLNLIDVYYGLSLQMLIYLEVVLQQAEEWLGQKAKSGGVLYFHIHDAMLNQAKDLKEEQVEREILKNYKMQGLINSEEDIIRAMDKSMETGWSDLLSVGLKKDGSTYAKSQVANEHEFNLLQKHIYQIVKNAGIEISRGEIQLNPYESPDAKACTYCPFKSVCQFDPILKTNQYRQLPTISAKRIFEQLNKEEP